MSDDPVVRSSGRPVVLALAPLLLIPCCWLWWWAGGLNPGLEIGRSAAVLLLLGCVLAAWIRQLPAVTSILLLALGWQAVALAWSPTTELGGLVLIERTAALATALLVCSWLTGRPDDGGHVPPTGRSHLALTCAGLGILALTALTQTSLWNELRVGVEAPFGNVNFAIGAALPLVAIGMAYACSSWRWLPVAGAALALIVLLARGWLGGDPCWAAWLGGGTALIAVGVLRLPARAHLPAFVILAATLLGLLAWGDFSQLGAGAAYRPHLWQAACEALPGVEGIIGHGPGAALAVLPEQPSFAAAWLTVPSWAAHAHNEALQVLLEGGVVLACLMARALWATLIPLWRERHDPAAAALLVGWITAGALACVESHLGQPGGLLCLALLAGATWARQPLQPMPRAARFVPVLVAVLLLVAMVRELAGDGGGPVSIDHRARQVAARLPQPERLPVFDRLRARLGPLDDVDLQRARAYGSAGNHAEAAGALAAHLARLPVDADALALARRMRTAGLATPGLLAAESRAHAMAAQIMARVPENAVNRAARAALADELAAGGPGPER